MVHKLPNFVDMAHTPKDIQEEIAEYTNATPQIPVYPYGLGICLGADELEKLDLEDDVNVGDMLHLFCLAKVTSVSSREVVENGETKPQKRVEMQITHIALENENAENEAVDSETAEVKAFGKRAMKPPYK